jgi:hypothetical protein
LITPTRQSAPAALRTFSATFSPLCNPPASATVALVDDDSERFWNLVHRNQRRNRTMRISKILATSGLLVAGILAGCASSSPDSAVKSDYRTQWTVVAADTKTTTNAAESVLSASDLKNVTSSSTAVDGMAVGTKADGTKVTAKVAKGENGSKLSVTVGELGDPKLGAALVDQIKTKAESK